LETIENSIDITPLLNLNNLLNIKIKQESKADFLTFVRQMAPKLVSDWKMGKHIEVISEKLRQLEAGEIKRLMVFLPPRSSKSVLCSKLFPAWYIGRNPEHEILTVSHSDQLSSDFGRSIMLLELDRRLQDEEHISQFLMMSCQKKTLIQKLAEDMSRNGILLD
jgi:hypothetical protein